MYSSSHGEYRVSKRNVIFSVLTSCYDIAKHPESGESTDHFATSVFWLEFSEVGEYHRYAPSYPNVKYVNQKKITQRNIFIIIFLYKSNVLVTCK